MASKHDSSSRSGSKGASAKGKTKSATDAGEPRRVKTFLVEPIDDFDFPPELQLPTFEEILEPPASLKEPPAPPERSSQTKPTSPADKPQPAKAVESSPPSEVEPKAGESGGMLWSLDEPATESPPKRVRGGRKSPKRDAPAEPRQPNEQASSAPEGPGTVATGEAATAQPAAAQPVVDDEQNAPAPAGAEERPVAERASIKDGSSAPSGAADGLAQSSTGSDTPAAPAVSTRGYSPRPLPGPELPEAHGSPASRTTPGAAPPGPGAAGPGMVEALSTKIALSTTSLTVEASSDPSHAHRVATGALPSVVRAAPPRNPASAAAAQYVGVLFIGDLHLASRVPGFRRDDYPKAILAKLRWTLDYARREHLLPVLLGDLFDFPRDNANWLLVELHHLLDPQTPAIYGNHDCKENTPGEHDTVSILVASGLLRLLSEQRPWTGTINGCRVAVGGTCWGQKLPKSIDRQTIFDDAAIEGSENRSYVLWASHHDLRFPGFEEGGRMDCREVRGVDLVVNGHIHRELHDVCTGRTKWMNPGSLTRISRSDASRQHVPGVLRVDVSDEGLAYTRVAVPHQPFDEVFHPDVQCEPVLVQQSLFVRDLAKLQSVRTSDGQGLREFLDDNLHLFEPEVSDEINLLAAEVLSHGE